MRFAPVVCDFSSHSYSYMALDSFLDTSYHFCVSGISKSIERLRLRCACRTRVWGQRSPRHISQTPRLQCPQRSPLPCTPSSGVWRQVSGAGLIVSVNGSLHVDAMTVPRMFCMQAAMECVVSHHRARSAFAPVSYRNGSQSCSFCSCAEASFRTGSRHREPRHSKCSNTSIRIHT